jgi:transposase
VIDLLKECSIEAVSRLLALTWDQGWGVMDRAVRRGLGRKEHRIPERIGVDEKSFAKRHKYETLVYDLDRRCVEYVADGRKEESLAQYYRQFNKEELRQIKVVAMDMWEPYIGATKAHVPRAPGKIVFDKFHVVQYVTKAVDKVRKAENSELAERGLDCLKNTKWLWLANEENIPEWRRGEFEELKNKDLKVARAWSIKENLRHFWNFKTKSAAKKFFKKWYFWATHSRLKPMIDAAKTLKRHLQNILTYFTHRVTNALGESINSKIEKIKKTACGYRNRDHYKIAIYFHCGGLDLYPFINS